MGAIVITGYTGTRQITPALDAAVHRSFVGAEEYILAEGNLAKGSMPSINQFTVLDGLAAIQGRMVKILQETLAVDTCATGYKRIDLIVLRFTHDNITNIDAAQLEVLKGTEVQEGNDPVVPSYNTGKLDEGATIVDMPLYQINLDGSTVTFDRLFKRIFSAEELQPLVIELSSVSSLPLTITNDKILKEHETREGFVQLSNQSAQTGEWELSASDGSAILSGQITGTTDISLWLVIPRD